MALLELSQRDEGGRTVVSPVGEVDMDTAADLRSALIAALDAGRQVVVDLGGIAFMDSTGVGVLVAAHQRARDRGGELSLRDPQPGTRKVLELTGVNNLMAIE